MQQDRQQTTRPTRFSALQRAENSSIIDLGSPVERIYRVSVLFSEPKIPQFIRGVVTAGVVTAFQCSSASRKFLNTQPLSARLSHPLVSVLFSEPKIPQFKFDSVTTRRSYGVSVLFSEPKIPQSGLVI